MNKITLILSWLILLIGLSCARNEDTLKDYTVAGEKSGIDTTKPSVTSTSPSDGSLFHSTSTTISVTFSEEMDISSITANTSDTECSGTLQVSLDDFSSCIKISSSPTVSNSNKTFSINPSTSLTQGSYYKIKVLTSAKDLADNMISDNFVTSTGFRTWNKASNIQVRYPSLSARKCGQSVSFGGSPSTAKYFAYPFTTGSSNIVVKYVGISLSNSNLTKAYIYTSSSGAPGSSLGVTSVVGNDYLSEVMDNSCSSESSISSHLTQAFFENGISLTSNTTYYVVYEYGTSVSNNISQSNVYPISLPLNRKYSNDLSSWTDWSGGGHGVYADNGGYFFLGN